MNVNFKDKLTELSRQHSPPASHGPGEHSDLSSPKQRPSWAHVTCVTWSWQMCHDTWHDRDLVTCCVTLRLRVQVPPKHDHWLQDLTDEGVEGSRRKVFKDRMTWMEKKIRKMMLYINFIRHLQCLDTKRPKLETKEREISIWFASLSLEKFNTNPETKFQ